MSEVKNFRMEKTLWLSFWGNLGLATIKLIPGLFGYSALLLLDGFHSSTNAMLTISSLIGFRYGEKTKDTRHPYGHGKAEFVFLIFSSIFVIAGAIYILLIVFKNYGKYIIEPHSIALLTALISVVSNELMHKYLLDMGHILSSGILAANARNNRFNTFTSSIVLVSIIGYFLGFSFMEKLGAMLIAAMLLLWGIKAFYRGIEGTLDRIFPARIMAEIKNNITEFKEVKKIEEIRVKRMGEKNIINLKIQINGKMNYANARTFSMQLRERIRKKFKFIEDVIIDFVPAISAGGKL